MRYLFLLGIHIYWLIPGKSRRTCIFKESCSRYVYRITNKHGFKKGLSALKERKQQCQPGYYAINDKEIRLADKSIIERSMLRESLL